MDNCLDDVTVYTRDLLRNVTIGSNWSIYSPTWTFCFSITIVEEGIWRYFKKEKNKRLLKLLSLVFFMVVKNRNFWEEKKRNAFVRSHVIV